MLNGSKKRILIALLPLLASVPAVAAEWIVDEGASSVIFETTAFGATVNGTFSSFGSDISLDPANLSDAWINAYVDTSSVETGNPDIDDALLGDNGFDSQGYRRARFTSHDIREADSCSSTGTVCLVASGTLTIRGVAQPMDLPFTLQNGGTHAVADGSFVVRPNDFHIGTFEWGLSGRETTVTLHIEADAQP